MSFPTANNASVKKTIPETFADALAINMEGRNESTKALFAKAVVRLDSRLGRPVFDDFLVPA